MEISFSFSSDEGLEVGPTIVSDTIPQIGSTIYFRNFETAEGEEESWSEEGFVVSDVVWVVEPGEDGAYAEISEVRVSLKPENEA